MDVALSPTADRSALGSPTLRWGVLGVLVVVIVAALAVGVVTIERHGSGGDPLDKLQSMRHPAPDQALAREQALGAAQDFITRFNTYGPQLLDSEHKMPAYEKLADVMTAKFRAVFERNVGIAEATVAKTKVRRSAQVYAAGVSEIDSDTAQVILAGVAQFSYPNPAKKGSWLNADPEHFRYVVSLDKQDGTWKIDDVDDIDDGLPPLGESSTTGGSTGSTPPSAPSSPKAPSKGSSGTKGSGR